MNKNYPSINIKAQANHHAMFIILTGFTLLITTIIFSSFFWQQFRLILIFFLLLSLIVIITGLCKKLEPNFSFKLTPDNIQYYHRYGSWFIKWDQIVFINSVKETHGLTTEQLPYIGIKFKNLDDIAEQISPRLANRLIHEQRPLLVFAVLHQLLSLEESQLNFSSFKLKSGKIIKGPLAAFLHHSQSLFKGFGYHLFIPNASMDRGNGEFCQLLLQCKKASKHYPNNL
ncbi:MAG: DUF2982 domain-containing protein [Alteromonadaceae bacterium]|nr:DUF2982 domain-containing protein [Alteromonadaceae bacterium]